MGAPDAGEPRAAGIWTLAGGQLIIAERGGPATVLVPTEQVRVLAVDLPLATRGKRLDALPFAVEDMIADPIEAVHLALGAEIAPRRYLVGVVRHDVMAAWVDAVESAGLGHAALVPDALALPQPEPGSWAVDLAGDRALVRAGDGTGFACPAALLQPAWVAAGRPPAVAYGAPLPAEMMLDSAPIAADVLADRLAAPALDLRQGAYARRRMALPNVWRRLGWIVALGAAAHIVIAAGDTLMLRVIADRRAAETRVVAALAAPGANLGDDLAASVADLLPTSGGGAPDRFLPLLTRVSSALGPLGGTLNVRNLSFQAGTLVLDVEASDATLQSRLEAALRSAGVGGTVVRSPDGSLRLTANAA